MFLFEIHRARIVFSIIMVLSGFVFLIALWFITDQLQVGSSAHNHHYSKGKDLLEKIDTAPYPERRQMSAKAVEHLIIASQFGDTGTDLADAIEKAIAYEALPKDKIRSQIRMLLKAPVVSEHTAQSLRATLKEIENK